MGAIHTYNDGMYSPIGPAIIISKINLLQSMTEHAIIQNTVYTVKEQKQVYT